MDAVVQQDCVEQWQEEVGRAIATGSTLSLRAGGTKCFLADAHAATELDVSQHRGVLEYQPAELVVTVRSGTTVSELNRQLAEQGQYFPCEPPVFDGRATVGGMVASGWSGPRRPWGGPIRDYVLGCRVITGAAKHLRFGGQVIKNVAGYDVSRLMAGSFGGLGILTEVSLKVLPLSSSRETRRLAMTRQQGVDALWRWRRQDLPVTGWFHDGEQLHVRLEGGISAVAHAAALIGGEPEGMHVWEALREHSHAFFQGPGRLWRLSLPMGTVMDELPGETLMDWAGAQWWLKASALAVGADIQSAAQRAGGYAVCYERGVAPARWPNLEPGLARLNRQLKASLDPHGVFSPSGALGRV